MLAYLVTCLTNGKQYIGITSMSVRDRWNNHLAYAEAGNTTPLHTDIQRLGRECFSVELIANARSDEDAHELERILITQHQTLYPLGYNKSLGGGGSVGWKHTEESLGKIRASKVGKPRSEETKAKLRAARLGKKASDETRAKMSKIHSNRPRQPHTEDTKDKMSEAAYTRWETKILSEETREKLRAAARKPKPRKSK